MMGFGKEDILSKESLELPTAKCPIPNGTINPGEWSFPETFTIPYVHDLIRKSRASGHRLFLSHLTSTTHYPFRSPKSWNDRKYTEHSDLNNYLNTIAWSDSWIEEIFGVLETEQIAEETLVVISGNQWVSNAFESTNSSRHTNIIQWHCDWRRWSQSLITVSHLPNEVGELPSTTMAYWGLLT